jgi:hypothetical protein
LADEWRDWLATASAAVSAALPWIVVLAPLALGPIVVFGPPAFDEFTKFLKSLGWVG